MNIIIDSSNFAKDIQFKSEALLNVIHLGQLGHINLYIPKTVKDERISNEDQRIKDRISSIQTNLKDLKKHGILDKELSLIEFRVFWFLKYYEEDLRSKWDYFITKSQAKVLSYPNEIGNQVMKSYFSGKQPFEKRKNRKDIPDAFIFEEIRNLLLKVKPITFVCADNNLRSSVSQFKDITTFSDVEELLKSPELKEGLNEIEKLRKEDSKWIDFLATKRAQHIMFIKDNLAKNIINELFESFQIYANFNDIRIVKVNEVQHIDISYNRFVNLPDSEIISVPAKAQIVGVIRYRFIPDDGSEPNDELREIVFDSFFNLEFLKNGSKVEAEPKDLTYFTVKH